MAQETGIFSVRRPRETLANINPNVSGIPLPSSAMKRSNSISNFQHQQPQPPSTSNHTRSMSGSRKSLAPGRPNQPKFQRSSSGTNLTDMGAATVQRTSTSNMLGSASKRKSMLPGMSTPAPPTTSLQQSTERRSSIYSARHSSSAQFARQSFFATAPIPAGVPRDPRPLKDRTYQAHMAQELMDYLTHHNFEMDMRHSLTQKTFVSPVQKDFNLIFQWLYQRIDPSYRFMKNIDAEVPPLLKQLRYPFEKSITKTQLSSVGSQNSWPTFLGMLHWLMQLARMMDGFNAGTYDDAILEAGVDITGDKICFDYLADAYRTWLALDDDQVDNADEMIKPHVDAMDTKFEHANSKYLDHVKTLEAEHQDLQEQISELNKSGPRLAKLEEEIKVLEEDRVKFESYETAMERKIARTQEKSTILEEELQKTEERLREIEQDRVELQNAVDRQGIKIQDIDRMNSERERLQKGVESATARLEETKEEVSKKESEANLKLESLEKSVQEYNSAGYQVGIIPSNAKHAKGQNFELSLVVNPGPDFSSSRNRRTTTPESDRLLADANTGYQPHKLLNLDVKGSIKGSIINLRKEISERRNAAAEVDMEKKDLLDKIREAIEDKQQEVEGLGHRVRAAEEEFEKTREITNAQKMTSDAQIEKLEKELTRLRTTMTDSVQLMEQREVNTALEYEQLKEKAAALREELHSEVEKMLTDVVKFKIHVQQSLEDYEQFVAEEVEREWEEQEQEGGAEAGDEAGSAEQDDIWQGDGETAGDDAGDR